MRPAIWRRRLTLYWRIDAKENLSFLAMLAAPLLVLGIIVYFAFLDHESIEASRLVAAHEAARKRAVDLQCLAENIYFEARSEPLKGQYAVAEVTMNRLASPHFPDTICDVVYDTRWDSLRRRLTAHFSWTALEIARKPSGPAWDEAVEVATAVYDGKYTRVMPNALFYHATYVRPYWAKKERIIAKIGNHVFYR
jgi:spore germination cell wall hydrolase CwlJ-like protein